VSKGGQFQLRLLSNNQTEVAGTTWYYHKAWPQRYWKLWSDAIIHNIHERVLKTIKQDAEADGNKKES
jgi:transcription initiation factor IIE alpha subunit